MEPIVINPDRHLLELADREGLDQFPSRARSPRKKPRVDANNPRIIARFAFWWERNQYRILTRCTSGRSAHHAKTLRALVTPIASEQRVSDLIWPTT
jgi:hypothetical protein